MDKLTYKSYDGEIRQVNKTDALELIPISNLLVSTRVKKPYVALAYYQNKVLPVLGPLPKLREDSLESSQRPFLLILQNHAVIVQGIPELQYAEESQQAA